MELGESAQRTFIRSLQRLFSVSNRAAAFGFRVLWYTQEQFTLSYSKGYVEQASLAYRCAGVGGCREVIC